MALKIKEFKSPTVLVILLTIVLVILHYTRLLRPAENLVTLAIQPAQAAIYKISKKDDAPKQQFSIDQMSFEELKTSHQDLEDQVNNLLVENAHLKTLVDESSLLEDQMKFLEERSYQATTAKVTSRSTESLSQSIIVNRGKNDGLEIGLPVIINQGVLIGTVTEVQDHSAEILLLTSFNSRIGGLIQNEQTSPGIIQGEHNLSLRMEFIPQLDDILHDQTIITSGIDQKIPRGLVIGKITDISNEPGSLFQQASLQPFFDSASISVVSILVP